MTDFFLHLFKTIQPFRWNDTKVFSQCEQLEI